MTTEQPKCTAADGRTTIHTLPGVGLVVSAMDFNRLHAENEALRTAITKLHKAKGRYHTQLAVCDLFELCGLTAVRPARAGEKT
jgi:hypothetical protein